MALLSKTAPSGVSSTGIYNKNSLLQIKSKSWEIYIINIYHSKIEHTFPIGFIFKNSGVLFDTPISKFLTRSTFTPQYSAAMSVFHALLFPFPACIIYKQNNLYSCNKCCNTCHMILQCHNINHFLPLNLHIIDLKDWSDSFYLIYSL